MERTKSPGLIAGAYVAATIYDDGGDFSVQREPPSRAGRSPAMAYAGPQHLQEGLQVPPPAPLSGTLA